MHLLTAHPPKADMRLRYGPAPEHFGDLRVPLGAVAPHPVVLVIHGGFWRNRYNLDHIGHLCAALTASGYATWSLEYRRLGDVGGGWPGTFRDVAAGAAYLREIAPEHELDLGRVVALGHSAGGHLALWLAGSGHVPEGDDLYVGEPLALKGVVPLAGVCDLRQGYEMALSNGVVGEFLGGSPEAVPGHYAAASPARLLPLGVPQVLIHGTEDDTVPFEISRDYAAAARAAGDPVELVALEGAGHFEVIDPGADEWHTVLAAIQRLVGAGSQESGVGSR